MSLRLLSSLLVALALFLTPLAMTGGAAMAHGGTATSEMPGHCTDPAAGSDMDHGSKAKLQCMAMCAAVPAIPAAMAVHVAAPRVVLAMTAVPMRAGIAPDRDTPPPRFFSGV
jgi:hypothetical protein